MVTQGVFCYQAPRISATSLALAEWVPIDAIEQRSVGRFFGCNACDLLGRVSNCRVYGCRVFRI